MSFLSGLIGGITSWMGADSAEDSAEKQLTSNRNMLTRQTREVAPFRDAGVEATKRLENIYMGTGKEQDREVRRFENSPEYQLNYDNMRADARGDVKAFGAGDGSTFSGRTLKALQDRAGQISSQLFGNYTHNLFSLAGTGASAASGTAQNMGAMQTNNMTAYANEANANMAKWGAIGDTADNMFGGGSSSYAKPAMNPYDFTKGA